MIVEQPLFSLNGNEYTIRAAVFAGQGTPLTDIDTKFINQFPTAKKIFSEASDVLGFSLDDLLPKDNTPITHETSIMQPLVVVLEYAKFIVNTNESNMDFDFFAGHSLGEVTALAASGMIDFSDAVRFARMRGILMSKAGEEHNGGIIAVRKLAPEIVEKIAEDSNS